MLAIREATRADAHILVTMIRELAEFERQLDHVEITPEDLLRDEFRPDSRFGALVAECDGQAAGYAVYFFTYSTWSGRSSLFVEDIFVRSQFRGKGIGKALMKHMAAIARRQSCCGMRWEVLDWNTAAIDFYRSLGATVQGGWQQMVLIGDRFEQFAREDEHP